MISLYLFAGGASIITPAFGLFFWTTLIFLGFWFILGKNAFKPIAYALKNREDSISNSLAAAEKAREEMAALQADNDRILQEAREEKAKIMADAKLQADKYLSDSKEKTKTEINRMMETAKAEISSQKNAALSEVKSSVGLLAVEMAEKVLTKELKTKKAHESHISDLVSKIKLN